jgi:hypothetical protein
VADVDVAPILAGIIGAIAGSVVSPIVTTVFTARREHRNRLRDARTLLYVDVNVVAGAYENFIRRLVDDTYDEPPKPKRLDVAETLDGRVQLLAPKAIRAAWHQLQTEMSNLHEFVFVLRGVQPYRGMAENDRLLIGPRESIRQLYVLTRKAAERG